MAFCFRLKFGASIRLQCGRRKKLEMSLSGVQRPVILASEFGVLQKSGWLVARSCGYPSEVEARENGERFRAALILSGVISRTGFDCGFDRPGMQFSDAIVDKIKQSTGVQLRGSIHGLDVFEEKKVTHAAMNANLIVLTPPKLFQNAFENAMLISHGKLSERQKIAASLINDFLFVSNLDVAFVLRVSAVEALCEQRELTSLQLALVDQLTEHLKGLNGNDDDKEIIRKALDNDRKQSVRSAYMSKIRGLLSREHAKKVDALYEKRGKFVHDGKLRGQLGEAAGEAFRLASDLLLAELKPQNRDTSRANAIGA